MIRKTKKKFIAVTMVSVVLVLAVLMTVLNGLNYARMEEETGALLAVLAENGGRFPETRQPDSEPSGEPCGEPSGGPGASGEPDFGRPDVHRREPTRPFTVETPYATRFFSVTLGEDGSVLSADTDQIAAVTREQAGDIARRLWAAGQESGYYVNYKYGVQPAAEGVQYVFLDCTDELSAVESFLKTSVLVSVCGVAVIYGLVLLLSGWAIRPMAESYEKQKTFITNAGHELKTPLTVIGSCTDVLELEQGESKWSAAIREQVGRLGMLTQDLVALARMDEGQTLKREDFDLSAAVEEELERFRVAMEQQGLTLSLDIQPGLMYRGDAGGLRQLAAILGDNALKYTAPGGEISFRLERKGRRIVLTGKNPAWGLTPGDQAQLFERFYRGDTSHSSETAGCGIGLSMAEAIAEAHGGTIAAHSEDGTELTITVQL